MRPLDGMNGAGITASDAGVTVDALFRDNQVVIDVALDSVYGTYLDALVVLGTLRRLNEVHGFSPLSVAFADT